MATIFFEIGTVFYSSLFWNEKVIKGAITESSLIDLLQNN